MCESERERGSAKGNEQRGSAHCSSIVIFLFSLHWGASISDLCKIPDVSCWTCCDKKVCARCRQTVWTKHRSFQHFRGSPAKIDRTLSAAVLASLPWACHELKLLAIPYHNTLWSFFCLFYFLTERRWTFLTDVITEANIWCHSQHLKYLNQHHYTLRSTGNHYMTQADGAAAHKPAEFPGCWCLHGKLPNLRWLGPRRLPTV